MPEKASPWGGTGLLADLPYPGAGPAVAQLRSSALADRAY